MSTPQTNSLDPMIVEVDLRSEMGRLKSRNADLERMNTILMQSNEDLERFALVASHDLQQPLFTITTYAKLLARRCETIPDLDSRQFANGIVSGATQMCDLLADLLIYTDLAAGPQSAPEAIDLNVVLSIVKENLRASIDETKAIVTSDRLPMQSGHASVFVSIFQNLIANAIKYRSDLPPRIHISSQREEGQVRFAVSDNGIGIEPEFHQEIFEPFKRLHRKNIPGTGLGLAICQRAIKRCAGRIWVESCPGDGTTVLFVLPNKIGQPAAAPGQTGKLRSIEAK